MVDSLVTVAFETLRHLLVEEVKLLPGVSNQVKQVERDLKTMHSFFMDADKWSNRKSNSLSNWIADLKDLAIEAEKVLEKYAVEVKFKREGQSVKKKLRRFACILSECFSVHQVGKDTEAIRSRLTNLTKRLKSMPQGESSSTEDQQQLLRLKYAHEVEQHFVGMEKDIECLVSIVKDEERSCSHVISICGMGGLGKTTLARKIYHHEDVQGCFEARAWVCVTQQFQAETILREIFKQVLLAGKDEINNMGQRELVVQLHNVLMQIKCLIVIDDIWEIDHWEILKKAFPTNCKVLLTTRKENIVSQESLYKLHFLTEDEGWELLQKTTLLRDDAPVLETELRSLEVIGRQIVQNCGRLPLAISVVGGILCQKRTLTEWKNVNNNLDSYLKHGEGVGNDTRVNQVLDLSYHVLPYYLKPCFLYLGCFPEDEDIDVEKLYLLWIAEGLISSADKGNNETLKDVAERYLTELAFRCMIQVQKDETFTAHKKFRSCRLHDLMRDLCSSKAEEEKFLKRADFYKCTYGIPSIRRLAMCVDGASAITVNGIQKHEGLGSFLVIHRNQYFWQRIQFRNSIINFEKSKYLKILILDGCEFEGGKLPSKIGKLIHLRYLSLLKSKVKKLPLSICNLPYLQTLDLRVMNLIKVPNVIYKMTRLRHLFLNEIDVIGGDKLKLDALKELETLVGINSGTVCIAEIPRLTNLRTLSVGVNDMDSLSIVVHHMTNNQSQLRQTYLSIESCDFSSEEGANIYRKILECHSLVSLELKLVMNT